MKRWNAYEVTLRASDVCFFKMKSSDEGRDECDEWGGAESRGNGARPVE